MMIFATGFEISFPAKVGDLQYYFYGISGAKTKPCNKTGSAHKKDRLSE